MKYRTLVVDPPWKEHQGVPSERYGGGVLADVRPNFKLMSREDLLSFPIDYFAAKQSHLYLWTKNSHLRFAFEVMEAWGFKFHCLLVWNKSTSFVPVFFQFRNEFVLFGYRGYLRQKNNSMSIPTHFYAKTREIARKPDELYQIAKKISLPPRIDIFSREKRKGWKSWGDEVEKFNGL